MHRVIAVAQTLDPHIREQIMAAVAEDIERALAMEADRIRAMIASGVEPVYATRDGFNAAASALIPAMYGNVGTYAWEVVDQLHAEAVAQASTAP